jgi:DNA repair protein RadC
MNIKLTEKQKVHILNSADVYKVMQQVLLRENKIRRNQEHFWVVGLDKDNKILFVELISLGANNRVTIAPPEVFRMGIYKLAVSMILVHNHPGGSTQASDTDEDFTDRMMKSGKMLNIDVVDHLIITETKYSSLKDLGIMAQLRKNGAYELVHKDELALRKMQQEMEKEAAAKEAALKTALKIAKKLLSAGFEVDDIKKATKLTKKEIEGLGK